jgi:hypothetical protein
MSSAWNDFCKRLLARDENWEVWIDWFEDRKHGRSGIEALEVERALISDEDWQKGAKHVNGMVKAMIAYHRLPTARTIKVSPKGQVERDPIAGLPTVPTELSLEDVVRGMREGILSLIEWHKDPQRWQEYNSLDRQFGRIEQALSANALNPEAVHGALASCLSAIDRRGDAGYLKPAMETDDLYEDLDVAARKLRVLYPILQKVHEADLTLKPAPLSDDTKAALNEAAEALSEIVEQEFAEELRDDVASLEVTPLDVSADPTLAEINKPTLHRILGYFVHVRRLLQTPAERLLARVDKGVDVAKRVADFNKAITHLDKLWDRLKDLLSALFG